MVYLSQDSGINMDKFTRYWTNEVIVWLVQIIV